MTKNVEFKGGKGDIYAREKEAFKKNLVVENGTIKETKRMAGMIASLPEDLDEAGFKKYGKAVNGGFNGFLGAASELAASALLEDPKLDQVTGQACLGEGNLTRITIKRQDTTRNPKTGEQSVKDFAISMSTRHRGPDYDTLRKEYSEKFSELL